MPNGTKNLVIKKRRRGRMRSRRRRINIGLNYNNPDGATVPSVEAH